MELRQLFAPADLLVGFDPTDKWDAIARLVEHLVAQGKLPGAAASAVVEQVLARERSMSTGMERGIAIPHAAVEQADHVIACMGIVQRERGLDFESIDGKPTRIVVLLVIPRSQKLLHIRTLADVARVLGNDAVRETIVAAPDSARAWESLASGDATTRR
ncbi:MAG: PTS sugar transporter subunit IIA [Planctomycetes bacterium]|nr:PTS sugar transporter subunit IIA [Planctomycetota bacterium]